uniref:Disease resistance R13L4/SHOC-2-like LRR domain-containing protein n=1 Tax=Cannabis sativa TaxID=3483 RepID=A0A803PMG7_CANSA
MVVGEVVGEDGKGFGATTPQPQQPPPPPQGEKAPQPQPPLQPLGVSPPVQLPQPPSPPVEATTPQPQQQPQPPQQAPQPPSTPVEATPQLPLPEGPMAPQPQLQPPPSADHVLESQPPPMEAVTPQLSIPEGQPAPQPQLQPPTSADHVLESQPQPMEATTPQLQPTPAAETAPESQPQQPQSERPTASDTKLALAPLEEPSASQKPPSPGATASQPEPLKEETVPPKPQPHETPTESAGATAPTPAEQAGGTTLAPTEPDGASTPTPQSQRTPPATGAATSKLQPSTEVKAPEPPQKPEEKAPETTETDPQLGPLEEVVEKWIKDEFGHAYFTISGEAGVGKTHVARKIFNNERRNILMKPNDDHNSFAVTLWLSLNKRYDHHQQEQERSLIEDLARQLSVLDPIEGAIRENVISHCKDEKGDHLKVLMTTCATNTTSTESSDEIPFLKHDEFLKLMLEQFRASKKIDSDEDKENEKEKIEKLFKDGIFKDVELQIPAAMAVLVGKAFNSYKVGKDGATYESLLVNILKKICDQHPELNSAEKIMRTLACFVYEMLPSDDNALINCCWHSKKFFSSIKNQCVHYNELIAHWILEGYLESSNSIEKAYEDGYRILNELRDRKILKREDYEFVKMEKVVLEVPDVRYKKFEEKTPDLRYNRGFDDSAMLGLPEVLALERDGEEWKGGFGRISVADGMIRTICKHNKWREQVSTLFMHGNRLCRDVPKTFFKPMSELETLVLINPRSKDLMFLSSSSHPKLRVLVVRGCDVLENIDSISGMNLTVLEISGAKSLKSLPDNLFDNMPNLRSLNLSEVQVEHLPKSFDKLTKLQWLILRGCSCLKEMPNVKSFVGLKVLDMAGVSSLMTFKDKNFGELKDLRVLDYSHAKIAPAPFVHSLHKLTRLTHIGCSEITRVPHFDQLSQIQILELSGATKLVEFYVKSLQNKSFLRILDLSKTNIKQLPPSFSDLPRLEKLDLSDMSSLNDLTNVSFSQFRCLQIFNLSNTPIKTLPSLSNLSNLRELILTNCMQLEKLPEMEGLTNLEKLDVSGANALKEVLDERLETSKLRMLLMKNCGNLEKFPSLKAFEHLEELDLSGCKKLEMNNQSFEGLTQLQILDLSETKIQNLSSVFSPELRQLVLSNCVELVKLPTLSSSSKLEEINLSGAKKLLQAGLPFNDMKELQSLDLSETSISLTSNFSQCTNLKKLSLRKCVFVGSKPELEKLELLEVLDLSDTTFVASQSSTQKSNEAFKLDGSQIEKLLKLTDLDLRGTQLQNFPYWISKLKNLNKLRLPNLDTFKEVNWGQIKRLPNDLNWEECGIFNLDAKNTETPSISINGTKMFNALMKKIDELDNNSKNICIFVCPLNKNGEDEEIYRERDDSFFKNLYLKNICCPDIFEKFLEIRGFETRPNEIDDAALMKFDCLCFIEDDYVTCVADVGGKTEKLTSLWLERCSKIEFIFSQDKHVTVSKNFNLLWVSNLPNLTDLYIKNVEDDQIKNLKQLYLDCCPKLQHLFTNPDQLPESLEKLQVKFCDKLENLFKFDSFEDKELKNLKELHLLELPELIGVGIKFPCLKKAKVKGCPKLEQSKFINGLGLDITKTVGLSNVMEDPKTGKITKETTKYRRSEGETSRANK